LRRAAPWAGLLVALALVAAAFAVPPLTDWEVWSRAPRSASPRAIPPLHGLWEPKLFGAGTVPAVLLAIAGWRYGARFAERLTWPRLLVTAYVVGLAWLLTLALVDGPEGLSRALRQEEEYLPTARSVEGIGALLDGYVDRIPLDAEDNWPTHVAGHPPLMLLFFVGLVRLGLGGDVTAGLVVAVIAATIPLAVVTTLRALGGEDVARRAVPLLVLAPAAVFLAVSADAVIATVAAWGLACLALAATRAHRTSAGWSVAAGLLLGCCVLMSYGMVLLGPLAVAVLAAARRWRPLPVAAAAALAVVLLFAVLGFTWWEAFPVLRERYWAGIADDRPATYWWWGNLAALVVATGPLLGAGLAHLAALGRRAPRAPVLLVAAAAVSIATADASGMSRAEVERIWLPFVPWLLVSCALLPDRWRRVGLAVQLVWALLVQHLLYTSW
jgi:hypothetical protein